jgi:hypothetical protein
MEFCPASSRVTCRLMLQTILIQACAAAAAVSCIVMSGCDDFRPIAADSSSSHPSIETWNERASAESLVVLTYSLSDVFACQEALQEWRRLDRQRPGVDVRLELTHQPNDDERTRLALARWDRPVVRESRWGMETRRREVLMVGGREVLVAPAHSLGRKSPVLRALAYGTASTGFPLPDDRARSWRR